MPPVLSPTFETEKTPYSISHNQQVDSLFIKAGEGNSKALNTLAMRYFSIVLEASKKFFYQHSEKFIYEDFQDIAQNTMLKFSVILKNYLNASYQTSFESFLVGCVKKVALDMVKSNNFERNVSRRKLNYSLILSLLRLKKTQPGKKNTVLNDLTSKVQQSVSERQIHVLEGIQGILSRTANAKRYLSDKEIFDQLNLSDKNITLAEIEDSMEKFEVRSMQKKEKLLQNSTIFEEQSIQVEREEVRRGLREFQKINPLLGNIIHDYYFNGSTDLEIATQRNLNKKQSWCARQSALKKLPNFIGNY